MNVVAICTPPFIDWRWRIVSYDGAIVEESPGTFGSIASAVKEGTVRLRARDDRDVTSMPSRVYRSTSHLRNR